MTDESLPIVSVSFRLGGKAFDPDLVTTRLGIEPTNQYRAGDHISKRIGRRPHDGWIVRIGPRQTVEVASMFDELRGWLIVSSAVVTETCNELGLEPWITCAVEPTSKLAPSLLLSSDVIGWARDLGASIDVDLMLWHGFPESG